jgi:hypothetical protein
VPRCIHAALRPGCSAPRLYGAAAAVPHPGLGPSNSPYPAHCSAARPPAQPWLVNPPPALPPPHPPGMPTRLVGFDLAEPTGKQRGKAKAIAQLRERYPYETIVMVRYGYLSRPQGCLGSCGEGEEPQGLGCSGSYGEREEPQGLGLRVGWDHVVRARSPKPWGSFQSVAGSSPLLSIPARPALRQPSGLSSGLARSMQVGGGTDRPLTLSLTLKNTNPGGRWHHRPGGCAGDGRRRHLHWIRRWERRRRQPRALSSILSCLLLLTRSICMVCACA